ncbi:hypothetical protein [Streptomyces sp. NPDC017202]|uniref:hypothetical protein n=1 Tax=Streptomyces sp. NPDC017202 TaxID=3364981 RepID=UPI0037AF1D38
MIRMEWDGLTGRERSGDRYPRGRDRFADTARDADRNGLFEELGSRPERVDLPRPGNRSGFAPLHQAAWHGADFAVVSGPGVLARTPAAKSTPLR